jgi:hypothetical protein
MYNGFPASHLVAFELLDDAKRLNINNGNDQIRKKTNIVTELANNPPM